MTGLVLPLKAGCDTLIGAAARQSPGLELGLVPAHQVSSAAMDYLMGAVARLSPGLELGLVPAHQVSSATIGKKQFYLISKRGNCRI